jgi:hypothetical protein
MPRPSPRRTTPPGPRRRWPSRLRLEALEDRTVPTVQLGTNFAGLAFPQSNGFVPPDTTAAVGPSSVIEEVNTTVAIYNKTTGAVIAGPQSLDAFFNTADSYDPVVVYDDMAGKFVVMTLQENDTNQTSSMTIAISKTSNPTNLATDFNIVTIDLKQTINGNPSWADYPKVGYNADGYYFTLNMFAFGGPFQAVKVVATDKAGVVKSQSLPAGALFTMAAAVMHGAPGGGPEWFVTTGNGSNIQVTRMDNPQSAAPTFTTTAVGVNAYTAGGNPSAPQGNGVITTNDARMLNAEWRNNRLVSTLAAAGGSVGNRTVARWFDLSTSGANPTLNDQGIIDPGAGIFTYFPSIAIDASGDLGMTYMQSSAGTFISMFATGRNSTDAAGTMETPVLVKGGAAEYNDFTGSPFRAGDYSATGVDPSNPTTFWVANEYATNAASENWGTWIGSISIPGAMISGTVYNDLNGDGAQNVGELGLSAQTLYIDANSNGQFDSGELSVVSNGSGQYSFTLPDGTYTVRQVVPNGFLQTEPAGGGGYTVTISGTNPATGKDFGDFQLRSIAGTVFNDLNGNGQKGGIEPGLQGWVVGLFNAATGQPVLDASNQPITATTDSLGFFTFSNLGPLPAGAAYRVREVVQGGWEQTSTNPADYPSIGTPSAVAANFGDFQFTSLTGTVFEDKGGDGLRDPGDPGLQGWTVGLFNGSTGQPIRDSSNNPITTTTAAGGSYSFNNLGPLQVPGNSVPYRVRAVTLSGLWEESSNDPPDVLLTSGTVSTGSDFGFFHVSSLSGTAFDDTNGDGTFNPGEPGLANVTVNLINPNTSQVIQTTQTDGTGHYAFNNLFPLQLPGNAVPYELQAQVAAFGTGTSPSDLQVTLTSSSSQAVDFGTFRPAAIAGQVYEDRGGDGNPSAGDPGLGGWTVQLLDAATGQAVLDSGNNPITTTTAGDGSYSFAGLVPLQIPGNGVPYRVRVTPPAGWTQSSSGPADVSVRSGTTTGGENFGEFRFTSISGRVFADANGDGVPGVGDPGLAGFTVQLHNGVTGAVVATVATDGSGGFTFTNVGPVSSGGAAVPYTLDLAPHAGFIQTTTPSPQAAALSGTPVGGIAIGGFQTVAVAGRVFEDLTGNGALDVGDPAVAGQPVQLIDSVSGAVLRSATTDATGSYAFAGLPALADGGSYQVRVQLGGNEIQTTPNPADIPAFSGGGGGGDFGLFRLFTLGGQVFADLNGDGAVEPGDSGLAGWGVILSDSVTGAVYGTVTTDASGAYVFGGLGPLPAGSAYRVREVPPFGWAPTNTPADVPAVSGGSNPSVNFGNFQLLSLSGRVFGDTNRDGRLSPGERGLRGITVNLLDPLGNPLATTTTDALGNYSFAAVGLGAFIIRAEPPAELTPTTAPGGLVASTSGDANATGLNIGFATPALYATGADAGGAPHVKVFNADGSLKFSFFAYDASFTGGVRVAVADVNGDGVPDIITGAGAGGGPHVKVFDGHTGQELMSFFAYSSSFTGGVFVAAGDVNGDGIADIITGAGAGGGPHVKVFDGADGHELASFFAYDGAFTGGVTVAAGDTLGRGADDIITGAGPGGGPHVKVFGLDGVARLQFFAFDAGYAGGVMVAAGDAEGLGRAAIAVAPGAGEGTIVRVYDGLDGTLISSLIGFPVDPFAGSPQIFDFGVRVAMADVNGDGRADLLLTGGPGSAPRVRIVDALSGQTLLNNTAYDPGFLGGVYVA